MMSEEGSAKSGQGIGFFRLLLATAERKETIPVQGFTDLFLICPHNSRMQ